MKTMMFCMLVTAIATFAVACGGADPAAELASEASAAEEAPPQRGEIHLEAIERSLVREGDADAAREQCGAPQQDPWDMCSQWCCVRVVIWGMEACWWAPAPGQCPVPTT